MQTLHKGDIVKVANGHTRLVTGEQIDKLGLISEVVDDTMIRIGDNWFDTTEHEVTVLHAEG